MASSDLPLVSVFMFVRNGAASLRRAMDSVMAQTYPNIEIVIQDAVSTDETLDILRGYGERLKIVSEPDSGPSDGLLRALRRCTGEFIGSCLADEELLPDAIERAVEILRKDPEVGAVTGDAMITNLQGKQTGLWTSGPFSLVDYLTSEYCPYFCASVFRRDALHTAGLMGDQWTMECVEFELWCRLAAHSSIEYVPGVIAKYASHPDQSSNKPNDVIKHMRGRLNNIIEMCRDGGLFGPNPLLLNLFLWGHARRFCEHAMQIKRPQMAEAVYTLVRETLAGLPKAYLDGIEYDEDYAARHGAAEGWAKLAQSLPFRLLGLGKSPALRRWVTSKLFDRARRRLMPKAAGTDDQTRVAALLHFPTVPDPKLKGWMYAQLALKYEAAKRYREALAAWQDAAMVNGVVKRVEIDGRELPPVGYTHIADG